MEDNVVNNDIRMGYWEWVVNSIDWDSDSDPEIVYDEDYFTECQSKGHMPLTYEKWVKQIYLPNLKEYIDA